MYTYLTVCFLVTGNRVMQYMLILYAYDTNVVLVKPKKTRSDAYMLHAYDVLYDALENAVQAPRLNIMENEASKALKKFLQKRITVVQLAPPNVHR